jgi:2-(1,2-epoxy-1,2-dihydrophenyl)acetyl-CoA isomerase
MGYEQIEVGQDGAVATIALNRPEKLNALTGEMSDELMEALAAFGDDVRAVVITGAGRGFCAGQDLTEFEGAYRAGQRPDIREHLARTYHRLIPAIVGFRAPVIAAVNGVAAGAGLSLVLACDLRVASEDARFTQAFTRIGLVPDSGSTWLLPRVVGYARAVELTMTSDVIDAGAALDLGLVTRVFPSERFENEVASLAERLASLPTLALVRARDLMRAGLTSTLDEALRSEADVQAEMGETEDHLEGVMAFAEKRDPRFTGR